MSNSNGKLISALLIGAAAGAVLGLLFAPDKGTEVRKKMMKGGNDLMDDLCDRIEEGKEMLKKFKEKVVDKAEDYKSKASDFSDEVEQKVKKSATL